MMVLAYWDAHGYPDLIPGEAAQQTQAIDDLIASAEHVADYVHPLDTPARLLPDRSEIDWQTAHPDNSLADAMFASRSAVANPAGYAWEAHFWNGLAGWSLENDGPEFIGGYGHFIDERLDVLDGSVPIDEIFARVRASLDQGSPVVGVTSVHQGIGSDDYVVVIGYEAGTTPRLAYLDPNDPAHAVHWRDFIPATDVDGFSMVLYFRPGKI